MAPLVVDPYDYLNFHHPAGRCLLEAFDLCGSLRGAGELAGVSHHTVARYVAE